MHAFLYPSLSFIPDKVLNSIYCYQIKPENSIGIEDIRNSQLLLSRLPPHGQKNYLVVHDAEKMTVPAQNAFLKTLEEPPTNCEIYLISAHPDQLLPTILSRIEIVKFFTSSVYSTETLKDSRNLWQKLQKGGVGDRLAVIDETKFDRESFLHFLSDLEYILHENLSQNEATKIWHLVSQAKVYTQANCNLRLVQDYFIILLSSTIS